MVRWVSPQISTDTSFPGNGFAGDGEHHVRNERSWNQRRQCGAQSFGEEPFIGHAKFVMQASQHALALVNGPRFNDLEAADGKLSRQFCTGQSPLVETQLVRLRTRAGECAQNGMT